SPAKYRLFGGAAGPGKTKALLWECIQQALRVCGADTLLLRRTYPELESSLLAYFRRDVPRAMYTSYNEAKHLVTWTNGSTTRFGHCRNENDVYQYQGAEFLFIGIDELTHFTLKQWQFLTSRNRCPVPNSFSNMAGATNPGNVGHAWGFQHPSAVYWHCAIPGTVAQAFRPEGYSSSVVPATSDRKGLTPEGVSYSNASRIVTYREFVQNGLSPRMLAQAIAERSGRE